MPSSTTKQAKTMSAIDHGWRPTGSAAKIPVSVAKEFHAADKGHKYGEHTTMKHNKHIGHAEHHEMHREHHSGGGGKKGHEHHAAHHGFAHHSPHHHENANSHKDGRKEHDGPHNPVEHGYGFGRHHDGKTEHGAHIAGGEGKHAHDALKQSIAGGYNPQGEKRGEHESRERSRDNGGEKRQPHGRRTGEDSHRGVEDRSMEHHIAGGEHGHHEHGSGRAEHHPSHAHMEPHRFRGQHVAGAHGYGHGVHHRDGHHRMSGHPAAHRIGKRD